MTLEAAGSAFVRLDDVGDKRSQIRSGQRVHASFRRVCVRLRTSTVVFTSPPLSNFNLLAPPSPPLLLTSSTPPFNCELPPQVFRRSALKVVERKAKSIFVLGVALILMAFSYENLPEFERSPAP